MSLPRPNTPTAEAAPNPVLAPAAPSNAPTIFLLVLVIGMMGFVAWWAFLGKDARANANATLPPPPRLDAVRPRPKPTVAPVPAASAAPDSAAPNETAPVISEVPAPAPKRQKPVSRAAENDD